MQGRLAVLEKDGMYAAGVFTAHGLFATSLPGRSRAQVVKAVGGAGLDASEEPAHLDILRVVFDVYEGESHVDTSEVPFDFSGLTEKEQRVLKQLLRVPRGHTVTYGQLASASGIPGGARFVGNVMARNRFAPLIPCHRVVSSTGLGGYGAGLATKREFLKREGAIRE